MMRSQGPGILIGIVIGVTVTAVVMIFMKDRRSLEEEQQLADLQRSHAEVTKKNKRLEEERSKRAAEKPEVREPKVDDKEEPSDTESIDNLRRRFRELAKGGFQAMGGSDFRKLAKAFRDLGEKGIEELARLLKSSESATERFMAAALLEKIGDPAAISALGEAIAGESDMLVRRMISHALAVIGTDGAADPLRTAMTTDKDWGVRVNSSYGLAKLSDEQGLNTLKDYYLSEETPAEYRLAVLGGLADVAHPSYGPLFRKILQDTKEESYILMSLGALAKMKDAAAIPELQKLMAGDYPDSIKQAAEDAIDEIQK